MVPLQPYVPNVERKCRSPVQILVEVEVLGTFNRTKPMMFVGVSDVINVI